jgi:transcriptional regulator with XRE-family HTH domain
MRLDREKVRWHRDRLGLTLDTLGEKAEVAKGTVLRAEHGEDVRPSSGRRIARALGVDISELVPDKPGTTAPKTTAPLSFEAWLEDRCGSSYLAMPREELEALFESLDNTEKEAEKRREIFDKIHREYLATAKTKDLPPEERIMVRGHHKAAASKWTLALGESGLTPDINEEAKQSIRDALSAAS